MKILSILALFLLSLSANALPVLPLEHDTQQSLDTNWRIPFPRKQNRDRGTYDPNGIVKLSNCSGSIVRFYGQSTASKAYVLTNGHCIMYFRYMKYGEYRWNDDSDRRMEVFNGDGRRIRIRATTLSYATMTSTDLALYRLEQTYDELATQGVTPLMLNDGMPSPNTEIQIISGYWGGMGYSCYIDDIVGKLVEDEWVWWSSIRYTPECDVISGTSGSPVIDKHSRRVIGVNNTYNNDEKVCSLHNPCEVDEDGNITSVRNRGYGQQTYWLYSCIDENFEIDLHRYGCLLHGASNR